jgi:hypothetical protein
MATVKNSRAPSVAINWGLSVELPGKSPVMAAKKIVPDTITMENGLKLYGEDALYNKGVITPIPTGGQISGVLLFVVEGVPKQDIWRDGTRLTLTFEDVLGQPYKASVTLKGSPRPFQYLPGLRSPISTPPRKPI